MKASSPPLIIFGLDAGDPNLLLQWAREGYLPALASILKRGSYAKTGGPELISEHGVWLPLFSGISRGKLDFYYFRQLKAGTYELEPITGLDAEAPPFWAHLKQQKIFVMDVPEIFPVSGLQGIQLSNWAPHFGWTSDHPAFGLWSEPKEILQQINRQFGHPIAVIENSNSTPQDDQKIYDGLRRRIQQKGKICRHIMSPDRFDVAVIVFTESHLAGHQFWKYRHSEHDLSKAIRNVYQDIDRELGLILEQQDPNTNIVVTTSVGMEDFYPNVELTEAFTRNLGYQASPGPAPFSFHPMSLARRIIPEQWRIRMSRVLSRDRREQFLSKQFRNGTNWNKTTAFSIPVLFNGLIRVNLKEREPNGIVSQGTEYENLLNQIQADLELLTDPRTGGPAVRSVFRPGELYGSSPPPVFPDLWVHYRPATYLRERTLHPKAELLQSSPEFFRDSDHSHEGFLAACGPSVVANGDIGEVSLLDLAPTFLHLLQAPPEAGMSGQPLLKITR